MIFKHVSRRAFTIIELLVALTVTAVMVTLMLSIVTNVLTIWNRSSGKLNTGNQARLLLDQITLDLQGAIIKRDGNSWLIATVQQDQTTASGDSGMGPADTYLPRWDPPLSQSFKPRGANSFDAAANRTSSDPSLSVPLEDQGKLEFVRFGQAGVWLRFFTVQPDSNADLSKLSAPVAVSYQLVRAHLGGAGATRTTPISYLLFRSAVKPDQTFAAGYDLRMSLTLNPSYNRSNGTDGNPGNIRQPNANHVIASNVIDFGVRIYHRDATTGLLLEDFPAQRDAAGVLRSAEPATAPFSYLATSDATLTFTYFNGTAEGSITGIPEVVDIMVRILTPEGLRIIQAYEENPATSGGASDAKWWELAEAHSIVYTRRVVLPTRAL